MSSSPRHRSMLKLPRRRPQATSLIGVVDVKLLLFTVLAGYVASAGHALLFAVGVEPPHDGGQEARRLDLWSYLARFKPAGSSLLASSSRLSSPRERSGWPVRASSCVLLLPVVKRPPRSSDRQDGHGRGLPTEAERRPVAPHPVQDDSELAGDCDTGPRHASCLCDLHAPGAQASGD